MKILTPLSPYGTEESIGCEIIDTSDISGTYEIVMAAVTTGEGKITSKLLQSDDLENWEDVPDGEFSAVDGANTGLIQRKVLNTATNKRYIKHESYTVPQCYFGMVAF